jgi:hypothetical protein
MVFSGKLKKMSPGQSVTRSKPAYGDSQSNKIAVSLEKGTGLAYGKETMQMV